MWRSRAERLGDFDSHFLWCMYAAGRFLSGEIRNLRLCYRFEKDCANVVSCLENVVTEQANFRFSVEVGLS